MLGIDEWMEVKELKRQGAFDQGHLPPYLPYRRSADFVDLAARMVLKNNLIRSMRRL